MNLFEKAIDSIRQFGQGIDDRFYNVLYRIDDWITLNLDEPTLDQTLVEKNGKGPHGYGDPRDPFIREEEHYLFPRMIWKKIRYGKCFDVTEKYYSCMNRLQNGEEGDCKKEEDAMFACKSHYYSPENIEDVERECIVEYVQLRSKFRETGSEDDLWQLRMLMLQPAYNDLYLAYKRGASADELIRLAPSRLKPPSIIDMIG